jgi:hypothetical protein
MSSFEDRLEQVWVKLQNRWRGSTLLQKIRSEEINLSTGLSFPGSNLPRFLIRARDLGTNGLLITRPGYYLLDEDISFHSLQAQRVDSLSLETMGSYAIAIQTNNVVLDLNFRSITQIGGPQPTTGILVLAGFDQIEIKDGIISSFTDQGIWVQGDNQQVSIRQIRVEKCGSLGTSGPESRFGIRGGIAIDGTKNVHLDSCLVEKTSGLLDTAGISILCSEDIKISNSLTIKNRSRDTRGAGISILSSENFQIEGSKSRKNRGRDANGLLIDQSTNFIIKKVKTCKNRGAETATGIEIRLSHQGRVLESIGFANLGSFLVSGFDFVQSTKIELNDCSSSNNRLVGSELGLVAGYLFETCQQISVQAAAFNNGSSSSILTAGYLIFDNGSDFSFSQCLAANQFGDGLVGGLISIGPINQGISGGRQIRIEDSTFRCNISSDPEMSRGILLSSLSSEGSSAQIMRNQILGSGIGIELALNAINNAIHQNQLFGLFSTPIKDSTPGPNLIDYNMMVPIEIKCSSSSSSNDDAIVEKDEKVVEKVVETKRSGLRILKNL